MTNDDALVIWGKDAKDSWKVHSRVREWACGDIGLKTTLQQIISMKYARIDGEMLQLPGTGAEVGKMPICERCVNQLTCELGNREVIMTRADILPSA